MQMGAVVLKKLAVQVFVSQFLMEDKFWAGVGLRSLGLAIVNAEHAMRHS